MRERLTDTALENLDAWLDVLSAARTSTLIAPLRTMLAELRERRAADSAKFDATVVVWGGDDGRVRRVYVSGREMEALEWAKTILNGAQFFDRQRHDPIVAEHLAKCDRALAALDKLLAAAEGK